MKKKGIYEKYIKRSFDFLLALLALIILCPVLLVVTVLVRIKLGTPVIFKQSRPGKDGKIFALYKFRTMTNEKDSKGNLLEDTKRMTPFGHWLRKLSMDELPELWNIIKGDMSLVGPRPLLVRYLPYYTKEESRRHSVRPGLTGFAQIHGRNSIERWETRFEYDLKYVDHITFLGDCKIFFGTIRRVFTSQDVVDPGYFDDFDVYRTKQLKQQSEVEK